MSWPAGFLVACRKLSAFGAAVRNNLADCISPASKRVLSFYWRRPRNAGSRGSRRLFCPMNVICPTCKRTNPHHARFCACCGRAVVRPGGGKTIRGIVPVLLVLVCVVFWSGGLRGCPSDVVAKARNAVRKHRSSSRLVQQHFHLSPAKADALFKLIAPGDIRVIVGRRDHGVTLKGTSRELEVLQDFVELLTRHDDAEGADLDRAMQRVRNTWTKRETYKLPEDKAGTLFRILAFDDVPVLVHGKSSRVIVDATAQDHETLADVVKVLRGKRLR